jgi:hypothetical protein
MRLEGLRHINEPLCGDGSDQASPVWAGALIWYRVRHVRPDAAAPSVIARLFERLHVLHAASGHPRPAPNVARDLSVLLFVSSSAKRVFTYVDGDFRCENRCPFVQSSRQ